MGRGFPTTRLVDTSAAAVEVECEDGKLSFEGVATPTRIRGSCGRFRRTTRLSTTEAAWAVNA